MTVTGGAEWPRSWPRRLGGDGGGDSDQKRSETAPVLNGVCGGGKQGFSNRAQKERLWSYADHNKRHGWTTSALPDQIVEFAFIVSWPR